MKFDDVSRAKTHARVDALLYRYGLESRPRTSLEYQAIDELAVSEQVRGAAKREPRE